MDERWWEDVDETGIRTRERDEPIFKWKPFNSQMRLICEPFVNHCHYERVLIAWNIYFICMYYLQIEIDFRG